MTYKTITIKRPDAEALARLTESALRNGVARAEEAPAHGQSAILGLSPHCSQVDGYEEKWQTPKLDGNVFDLDLDRAHQ